MKKACINSKLLFISKKGKRDREKKKEEKWKKRQIELKRWGRGERVKKIKHSFLKL
jgi:cell division protein FtsL